MQMVGEYAISKAHERLGQVLSDDPDAIRTGRLDASLTVFETSDTQMVAGSNLPYAAQVHFGGRIEPKTGKALAIPLPAKLKRSKQWPSDLDPDRTNLRYVPTDGTGGAFAVLLAGKNTPGYREGEALFALVPYVTQRARPYMYWDDEDKRAVKDDLWPALGD